jgi:hypothetical protein
MKKRLLKNKSIIASLLIVALAFTELPWLAADAHAQTSSQITIHQPLSELSLKESLGKIATKSLSKENPHHVVVIQNAHAIAAAQISITKILKTLNENYGVKLVTLEGASERLDGLFFKTFPEKEVMKKVLNHYLDQGELAGAAASLLLNNEEMIYEGVENQDFYFKNIEVFMQALKKQSSLREAEKKIAEDLSKFKNQFFSPELKRLDSTEQHFRQDAIDLLHYLSILAEYKGEDTEKKYPLLAALWASLEKSDITFEEQKIEEIEKISSQISSRLNLHEEQKEFHAQKQQYETERQSSESFLGYLLAVAKRNKIQVTLSQKLKQSLQLHQRLEKVEGEKLYQEIETYVSAVKSDLFRNQKEKNLNLLTMRLSVLSKNIDFELNRKEWRQVLLQKSNDLDQIDVEFKALKNSLLQLEEEVYGETSPFHQFYALAQKREKALFENMKKSLAKHHQKNTAIVLGGFHTEGFVEFLKKENFSFDVIVPKIEKIENDDQYVQQMGGNVSWKNFLKVENEKIDVREAFNHAVMKKALLEKENKTTFRRGEFLKSWRDEMLREVVREGKASHASRYTHFMDDYFLRDLDHHELKKLREDWSRQVNQFTEKLKGAYESKQFSVEQVRALFNAPALESWVTLLSFTGEKVPAHWLVADLVTEAEVVSPSLSIPNLSARVSELEERAVSGRAELRRKVKVDQEEAEMSGGFIVKAPESWSSVRDVFVYEKGNLYPKRVDFKPNYEPLSMDVRDQLSEISEWDSVSGAARWSQKVSDPEKSQKIVIGVPTHDSSRGRLIYSQLEYFGELAKQIEKAKTAKPNWDIELVINVNGLNQESYLEDLRAFQQASDVSIVLLSMPFGGNVHDDPSPGKGNAVEMIRQYALESNADIVGLLDDDVTYLDRTQDNLAVESDSHLLSNLEFLIEQTRQNQSPVLVGSQYQKEYPKTLWRKFVKEPLTASGANQIRGISMFTFLDALPAMPSFPVNEDLYLTFYFRDVENAQNSLWRILSNPAAPVSFRTAGNFFSDYRQNYRWQLGDMWLFQLTYGAKRKFIHAQYGLSLFVQNIQILFSPWFWFRKVFINHLVGAELLVRQISGRPRMTTRWAQSVPEETKQRSELRSGEKLSPEEVVEARIVDFQRLRHELLGVFSDYRIKKSAGENLDAEKFLVKARRYGQILDPYIAEIRGINPTEKGELAYIVRRRNDGAWLKEEADDLGKNIDVYTQYFIEAYQADDKDRLDRLNEEVLNLLKRRLKIQLIRLQNELAKESINQGPLFLYFMSITNVYKRIAYEHLWREIRAGKNKEIARRFEMVDASGYLVSNLPYEQKPVLRFETDAKGKVQLTQIIWKYVEVEGGVRALQPILTPLNFEDFEEVFKNREKVAANIEEDYRQLKYHGHALESVKQTLLWYKDSGPMPEKNA